MFFLNLTPHAITVETETGPTTFPPSGNVARVTTVETVMPAIGGISVIARRFGEVEGLPEEDTFCIVSSLVAGAVPGRRGVFAPDTGPTARRDAEGRGTAVVRLVAA